VDYPRAWLCTPRALALKHHLLSVPLTSYQVSGAIAHAARWVCGCAQNRVGLEGCGQELLNYVSTHAHSMPPRHAV